MRVPVYILAGGQSRRFGSDKARAVLDGQPLLVRIVQSVQPMATQIRVVAAQADAYADLGLPTIADLHPGCGPIAGLEAALADCDQPWLALLSCDLLHIHPHWLERLAAHRTESAAAVAYRHRHWEPLLALYHQRAQPVVWDRLAAGQLRMQALLDELEAIAVDLPSDWPARTQANSLADLDPIRKEQP